MTAAPQGSGDTATSNINVFAVGNINLNGPVSIRSNGSSSSAASLNVRTTSGNIVHATGASNAIVVGDSSDNGGAAANFTAENGTVSLGHVSALSGGAKALISISGDLGVTLAGPITVQGRSSSFSGTGASLDVRANNGNINHTAGHIQVTNTAGSSSGGGARACFVAGSGNCSGSGGSGSVRTIALGKVTVTADGGWAQIGVSAKGSITLQDDITAQGRYKADIQLHTQNSSAGITLAGGKTIMANMTDTSSGSGGSVNINAHNNGTVDLTGAVVAYAAASNGASVNIQGGTVTVGSVTAGNASPAANAHLGQVNIQSQSGDITLNGPITVTGNSNSGSGASLYIRSANNNINHTAGSATAISVRNYLNNGGAKASFNAAGTATIGKVSVRGFEGADLNISALGGISVVDDLTATADSGAAHVDLYRGSGSPGSIPISLASGKFIRAVATGAMDGTATIDINGNGGSGAGDAITLNGTLIAQGGSGTNGQASIQVSGGNVALGTATATTGGSAQITVTGTDITLNADLTAADSIQLSPNYNGAAGDITGNGYNLATDRLQIRGGVAAGSFDVTTNAATIDVQGGASLTVNAAGQAGTLTALLGGSSANQAVGDVSITAGGTLGITQFWTVGTTHLLRADTLTLPGAVTMPNGAAVTLKPYTLSNLVGVHSATDTDVAIQTNYSGALLNLFPAGSTLTIGGAAGGALTGNIHVGADGVVDIGDKNLTLSTTGAIVVHNPPTTTGTITQISTPVVALLPAETSTAEEEAQETTNSLVSNLGSPPGGSAASGDAGNAIIGLIDIGAPPGGPPPVFQIQGGGLNLSASGPGNDGPGNGPDALDGPLRRR